MAFLVIALLLPFLPAPSALAAAVAQPAVASYRMTATYDVSVRLDWDTRSLKVVTTIDIENTSGGPVNRVQLNTVAAQLGSMRDLRVSVDGDRVRPSVTGQTIGVPLDPQLETDATARVRVVYGARLLTRDTSRGFFFMKMGGVAQVYRFIPWLSRRISFGSQAHGEPFLTPSSPLVRVTLRADRPMVWATTGQRVGRAEDGAPIYEARDVRDFTIAASPGFRTVQGMSRDGQTRIIAHVLHFDARRLISLARDQLARYESITGVAYPYPTFRIAESGGGLAMESPAMIWLPRTRGAADLPFLVSHEMAHQWWYAIVGNDQSTSAFADEAMAEYFSRRATIGLRPSRCARDRLDRDIRGYTSACYFEVIYEQGALFLDSLRRDFGDKAFRRAVRTYTRANRFGLGSNARLLEAFRAEMGDRVLPRYRARFPSLY